MSRIHDALRKAEQERASGIVAEQSAPLPETAPTETARLPLPAIPAVGQDISHAAPRKADGRESAGTSEAMLTQVAHMPWNPDKKSLLFADEHNRATGAEQFRSLRSHLYLIRKDLPLKKVLVTSPLPREGKTFVAGNLAQAFVRQQDRRVLVVDADLRRSDMHVFFGTSSTPGLTDYLAGQAELPQIIQRGPLDNFFFIPGGKTVTNPLELIGSHRLKALFDRLASAFDWILVDSPPATLVSDAKLLAEVCDGVLMVVEAASTPFDVAQKGCQEFRGKRILGVVLNRAEGGPAYDSFKYYDEGKETEKQKSAQQ